MGVDLMVLAWIFGILVLFALVYFAWSVLLYLAIADEGDGEGSRSAPDHMYLGDDANGDNTWK